LTAAAGCNMPGSPNQRGRTMPAQAKGARLWLRVEKDRPAQWFIKDGDKRIGTGLGANERGEAEQRLAEHIAEKHKPARDRDQSPSSIPIADVLSVYVSDRTATVRRPTELGQRVTALASFFGAKMLSDVNGALCRSYAAQRGSQSMARRELEDLRAAIVHHRREGLCNAIVDVVLPPKPQARERWLTRSEAARLIWAAWRYREVQKGKATGRRSRQHVARFILVGLYTGTRSAAICGAALTPTVGKGFADLDAGIFYRKGQGVAATPKRQPTVRLPTRLLAHMRRWRAKGISKNSVVEFNGEPVASVKKAFARAVADAGLSDVSPHVLRHTAITWAMQGGADTYDASDFFGVTRELIERTYGHHHPDHQKGVADALTRRPGATISGRLGTASGPLQ
jgi:integrase